MQKRDFPERITVEVTNLCNISCPFCPRQSVKMEPLNMGFQLFKKIADEAAEHAPVAILFGFRGEPLMNSEFSKFIAYAKSKGLGPLQTVTNGILLNESLQDELLNSGLDFINFSMDTNNKVLYEKSRGEGNFEISHKNVLNFLKKCAQRKAAGMRVPETQVSTVDIDEYEPYKSEFIDYWKQYADRVRVYAEHGKGGALKNARIPSDSSERRPCKKLHTDIVICGDSEISLCSYDWEAASKIGNISESTIYELWNGERYNEIRSNDLNNTIEPDLVCHDCAEWRMYYSKDGVVGELYKRDV